jgi:hypothetical protein
LNKKEDITTKWYITLEVKSPHGYLLGPSLEKPSGGRPWEHNHNQTTTTTTVVVLSPAVVALSPAVVVGSPAVVVLSPAVVA